MFENGIMGNKKGYVRSHADCQNLKKCVFTTNYSAIFAIALVAFVWLFNPAPALATEYVCYVLVNNGNRLTSSYTGAYTAGVSEIGGRAVTLPLVRDYCHDSGTAHHYGYYSWAQNQHANIVATRVITVPNSNSFTDYIQSWDMSAVASKLGCAAATGNGLSFPGINQVISLLPQSPTGMRIPTLITKMAGENSLAGNLAIELYSGAWQFLGILTSFKLFKIFFKGG